MLLNRWVRRNLGRGPEEERSGEALKRPAAGRQLFVLISLAALFGWLNLMGNISAYRTKSAWKTAKEMRDEMFVTTWDMDADTIPFRYHIFDHYFNRSMAHALTSSASFTSILDEGIFEFYTAIGYPRHTNTPEGPMGTNELLSVRYYLDCVPWEGENRPPVIRSNGTRDIYLYDDNFALPIGFAYDSYMTASEFAEIPKKSRSMAMVRALVVPDEKEAEVSGILGHHEVKEDKRKYTHEELVKDMADRRAASSENFAHDTSSFSCDITLPAGRYVFFSVPYTSRWSASVNGEKAEILKVNGFMAVKVPEGKSHIAFDYSIACEKAGALLSAAGILLWLAVLFAERRTKQ